MTSTDGRCATQRATYAEIVRFKSWMLIGSGALFAVALILTATAPLF